MMRITEWVMSFAPVGVFGLVARVVSKTGLSMAGPVLDFTGVVLFALALHAFVTLPTLLRGFGRVSPWRTYRAVSPALLTAFSTASSAATLPVTLDCIERGVGVSNRVSSFVLPLGSAVNMNGTALYECVAALFLAQAYGLHPGITAQVTVVVVALVTSFAVPGVPSASLLGVAIIVNAIGLPTEAIAALIAFDRLLDMARTTVNVLGDAVCSVIVATREGESNFMPARVTEPDA
jgi:Na+/H+-dicarboxylate symporter